MKKIIVVVIGLILISGIITAQMRQRVPYNSIGIVYQPADHGLGIRANVFLNSHVGVYGSASYGTLGSYKLVGYKNHIKLTTGISIPVEVKDLYHTAFLFGLNYHTQSKVKGYQVPDGIEVNHSMFKNPYSFEAGLESRIGRFVLGCRTDILRWEPTIDACFIFGRPNRWR